MAQEVKSTRKPVVAGWWKPEGEGVVAPLGEGPAAGPEMSLAGAVENTKQPQKLAEKAARNIAPPKTPSASDTTLAGIKPLPQVPVAPVAPPQVNPQVEQDLTKLSGYEQGFGDAAKRKGEIFKTLADPNQGPQVSTGRKIAGVLAGAGAGLLGGGGAAVGAYDAVTGGARRKFREGLGAELAGLDATEKGLKEQVGAADKGLSYKGTMRGHDLDEYGKKITLRGQDIAASGQVGQENNSIRDLAASQLGAETSANAAKAPYTLGEGGQRRSGIDNSLLAENPPAPKAADPVNMQEKEVMFKDGSRNLTWGNPETGQYFKRMNGQLVDVSDQVDKSYERPYSTGGMAAPMNYASLDDAKKAIVDQVAQKIATGEFAPSVGLSYLGGVKGGMGGALAEALVNVRVFPPKVREEITAIERARSYMIPIKDWITKINTTPDLSEKAKMSLQLENYVQAIGTQFARARGERGVVTDRDVNRVLGFVPGWKSANFAPGYAQENLQIIDQLFQRDHDSVVNNYFQVQPINGGAPGGLAGAGGAPATGGSTDAIRQRLGLPPRGK